MPRSISYGLFKIVLVVLLGLVPIAVSVQKVDYCKLNCVSLSKYAEFKNVACDTQNKFTDKCPSSRQRVGLRKFRRLILEQHNKLRNEIAGGVDHFKPAVRMAYMIWDHELTEMAFRNLEDCQMRLDDCRRTERFRYSGQNIGQLGFTNSDTLTTKEILTKIIGFWTEERINVTNEIIDKFPTKDTIPPIGHFTVMVAEKNTHVGCAAVQFDDTEVWQFILTCNYATTNIVGAPVYTTGQEAGSACKSGKNRALNNLCAVDEKYDTAN